MTIGTCKVCKTNMVVLQSARTCGDCLYKQNKTRTVTHDEITDIDKQIGQIVTVRWWQTVFYRLVGKR